MFAKLCFLGRAMPSLVPSLSAEAGSSCKQAEAMIKAEGRRLAHKEGHGRGDNATPFSGITIQIGGGCRRGSPLLTCSPLGPAHGQLIPATWGTL